jgi:hypothetical protein
MLLSKFKELWNGAFFGNRLPRVIPSEYTQAPQIVTDPKQKISYGKNYPRARTLTGAVKVKRASRKRRNIAMNKSRHA